jgi:hypothetical protein
LPPVYGITEQVAMKAVIVGDAISSNWTDSAQGSQEVATGVEPEPPYDPIYVTDVERVEYEWAANGNLLGPPDSGSRSAEVSGPETHTGTSSLYPSSDDTLVFNAMRPLSLTLNCAAGELTINVGRFDAAGGVLTETLHKTSAPAPPNITVEHEWRTEISAPVG